MTEEIRQRRESCEAKQQQIEELLLQLISFKKLIERNKDAESQGIIPTANSTIPLPFIIVNTNKSTKVNCSVTNDKLVLELILFYLKFMIYFADLNTFLNLMTNLRSMMMLLF